MESYGLGNTLTSRKFYLEKKKWGMQTKEGSGCILPKTNVVWMSGVEYPLTKREKCHGRRTTLGGDTLGHKAGNSLKLQKNQ